MRGTEEEGTQSTCLIAELYDRIGGDGNTDLCPGWHWFKGLQPRSSDSEGHGSPPVGTVWGPWAKPR